MEQGSETMDERPPLPCANGCGFFGSADTRGLCSKCYRQTVMSQAAALASSSTEHGAVAVPAPEGVPVDEGVMPPAPPRAKTRSRCVACGRSVGLMGFECRCGGVFCCAHRYSDRHECGYDYRGAGRDAIARANPVVRADKVDKI